MRLILETLRYMGNFIRISLEVTYFIWTDDNCYKIQLGAFPLKEVVWNINLKVQQFYWEWGPHIPFSSQTLTTTRSNDSRWQTENLFPALEIDFTLTYNLNSPSYARGFATPFECASYWSQTPIRKGEPLKVVTSVFPGLYSILIIHLQHICRVCVYD